MTQQLMYLIDLAKIRGNGDLHCPKCGTTISPDDETEDNYCILDTTLKDNNLDEVTIQCKKCLSKIRLTGFSLLATEDRCTNKC